MEAGKAEDSTPRLIVLVVNWGNKKDSKNAAAFSGVSWNLNCALIKVSPEILEDLPGDIIFHEYTHAVIASKHKMKTYDDENGALNEAYADIMAAVIENDQTWTISHPHVNINRDARQTRAKNDADWVARSGTPDDSNDHNGVHTNCNVIYHCAYLICQRLQNDFGMSPDQAMAELGSLWYDSISYLLTDNNTFENCLDAVYIAGRYRGYDQARLDMIEDCFRQVNVTHTDTFMQVRVIDERGTPITPDAMQLDGAEFPGAFSWFASFTVKPGKHTVTASLEGYRDGYVQFSTVDAVPMVEIMLVPEAVHSYQLFRAPMTWSEAERFCEDRGGHLATVSDQTEQDLIETLLTAPSAPCGCYWIGLRKDGENWSWVDETAFSYSNWALLEPNNKNDNEAYVHLFGKAWKSGFRSKKAGSWNDAANSGAEYADQFYALSNFGFVCEWDEAGVPSSGILASDAALDAVVRTYTGTYVATQGLTGLDFTITGVDSSKNVHALFSFYAVPDNKGVPSGCYRMIGTVDQISPDGKVQIHFTGTEWVVHPTTYYILDFTAQIDTARGTLTSSDYEISLNTSAAVPYTNLTGEYAGTYVAAQGITALHFTVESCSDSGVVEAVFLFGAHSSNPGVPSGAYRCIGHVCGVTQSGKVKVRFEGKEWINQPPNYSFLAFTTEFSTDRTEIRSDQYKLHLQKVSS